jgi:hypothetical protein
MFYIEGLDSDLLDARVDLPVGWSDKRLKAFPHAIVDDDKRQYVVG